MQIKIIIFKLPCPEMVAVAVAEVVEAGIEVAVIGVVLEEEEEVVVDGNRVGEVEDAGHPPLLLRQ